MLVRIAFVQPGAAEVAEMGAAFEANHVVATHGLLATRVARGTGRAMRLHVICRRLLFRIELSDPSWPASRQLTVPSGKTHTAESI